LPPELEHDGMNQQHEDKPNGVGFVEKMIRGVIIQQGRVEI